MRVRARQLHDERLEFRNNMAIAGWVFMAIWTGVLCLFTYIFMRDGGFRQYDPAVEWAILALFWLFGLGGCSSFFGMPRFRMTIVNGQVTVNERWLLRRSTETFSLKVMAEPVVIRDKDSEGDPYFRCRVITPAGRSIIVSESNDEEKVRAVCKTLTEAIGRRPASRPDGHEAG